MSSRLLRLCEGDFDVKKRLGFILLLLFSSALPSIAQLTAAQFSADMLVHTKQNDMKGKFFFTPTHTRMDMQIPGGSVSNITDVTEKKFYMVMHDRHMYMEHDLSRPNPMARGPKPPEVKAFDPNNPCANQEGTTCKKVSTETVNGRTCDKWEFSRNGKLESTAWIDQKLHVPVKSVREDGTSFELQNIKEGPQPDSAFTIPTDYQKFDMGNMMRGMGRDQ
jgi:hypothetical protein